MRVARHKWVVVSRVSDRCETCGLRRKRLNSRAWVLSLGGRERDAPLGSRAGGDVQHYVALVFPPCPASTVDLDRFGDRRIA